MTYLTLGNGFIKESQFADEDNNRPKYYGTVNIQEDIDAHDQIEVALWIKQDGSFSIKLSKKDM